MNIKKIIVGTAASAVLLGTLAISAFAKVERVAGTWDLTGTCEIAYTGVNIAPGPYVHTYELVSVATLETFSGTGYYNPNPAYTENIDGTITDSDIEFHVLYTGINAGYTVDAEGVINPDGSLTGIAESSTGQTFTFESNGSCASRFEGNHGQYVSSQENKQEAAQSRVGMPVQSKGHTK